MVLMLPLSALKQHVRREYFDGATQARNMQAWYDGFLVDRAVAVDVTGRHLVSGGPEGLKAFDQCSTNQIDLVLRQKVSGECPAGCSSLQLCTGATDVTMNE